MPSSDSFLNMSSMVRNSTMYYVLGDNQHLALLQHVLSMELCAKVLPVDCQLLERRGWIESVQSCVKAKWYTATLYTIIIDP